MGAAVTPDGKSLLVGVWGTTTSGSSIDVINTAKRTVTCGDPRSDRADDHRGHCRRPHRVRLVPRRETASSRSASREDGTAATRWHRATNRRDAHADSKTLLSASGSGANEGRPPGVATTSCSREVSRAMTSAPIAVAVAPDQAPTAALSVKDQAADRHCQRFGFAGALIADRDLQVDFGDWQEDDHQEAVGLAQLRPTRPYTITVTLTDAAGTSLQSTFTGQTMSATALEQHERTIVVTV